MDGENKDEDSSLVDFSELTDNTKVSLNSFLSLPGEALISRRTTSVHRNAPRQSAVNAMPSRRNITGTLKGAARVATMFTRHQSLPCIVEDRTDASTTMLEEHALQIAQDMEKDDTFMQDNPLAEQFRMETVRDMPQCLTIKRCIKTRLSKSVRKTKSRPISFFRQTKYRVSMGFSKLDAGVNSIIYSCELWYGSLKTIEGHYGTGVATYFRFLRSVFLLDIVLAIVALFFIVIPQLLYRFYEPLIENTADGEMVYVKDGRNNLSTFVAYTVNTEPYANNLKFRIIDLITGEGFLTNTTLYYGFYVNDSFSLDGYNFYNVPTAYFFTMLILYLMGFITLSIRMARSYRKSFIETAGGLKNIYAHKIFCGWDFGIATEKAASLKCQTIYNELKELLSENNRKKRKYSLSNFFVAFMVKTSVHLIVILLLVLTAYCMWILMDRHQDVALGIIDPSTGDVIINDRQGVALLTALVVTTFVNVFPKFFSWIVRFEDYQTPRTALNVTLVRTFILEVITVAVLIIFWMKKTTEPCWETKLGQEVYRLVLMDFFFSVILSSIFRFIQHTIYKYCWKTVGVPEFDIAHNTLNLIYNQTLFWVGFYFSPLLPVVIILKLFCLFYAKRASVLYFSQPSSKSWRAAQTHTVFLVLAFISLLGVMISYGYIVTQVPTSNCGPFRDYEYFYQMILQGVFKLKQEHYFFKLIMYLTKPGFVGGILIAMCVGVYYLRAKSKAQIAMVEILREMLILEAKDKEFLLSSISKVTEGQWLYNLQRSQQTDRSDWFSESSSTWRFSNDSKAQERRDLTKKISESSLQRKSETLRHREHSYSEASITLSTESQGSRNDSAETPWKMN